MLEENKELGQQTKEIAILNDINSFFCLVPVHFLIFSMVALLYHMTDQKQRTLIRCYQLKSLKWKNCHKLVGWRRPFEIVFYQKVVLHNDHWCFLLTTDCMNLLIRVKVIQIYCRVHMLFSTLFLFRTLKYQGIIIPLPHLY